MIYFMENPNLKWMNMAMFIYEKNIFIYVRNKIPFPSIPEGSSSKSSWDWLEISPSWHCGNSIWVFFRARKDTSETISVSEKNETPRATRKSVLNPIGEK